MLLAESLNVLLEPHQLGALAQFAHDFPGELPLYAWHPAGEALARAQAPLAMVARSQECLDECLRRYGQDCAIVYRQGKPTPSKSR